MDWTEQLSRPCPECGGRRERADVSGYMWLRPANARFSFSSNDKVHALVCATCGYTTFYADTPGRLRATMTGSERQGKGVPAAYIARRGRAEAVLCAIVRRAEEPETVLRWGVGRDVYSIQAHGLGLNDVLRVASSLHRL